MALQTLPFQDRVSQSSTRNRTQKILYAEYQGAEQVFPLGYNSQRDIWSASIKHLDDTEQATMWNFVNFHGYTEAFLFKSAYDAAPRQYRFVADSVTASHDNGLTSFTFQLRQVYA
ncbi:hypothetical protein [Acidovorax sp.]|uniref:hypothetical protein n=1 Tax=Acidovorax sp. TaxID=1872122 RepID=UPI00391F72A2